MMKRSYVIGIGLLFFLLFNLNIQAQETSDVDSYKIAFITQQLDLTKAEAEKFWPMYYGVL